MRFYLYTLEKPSLWPKILPRLQALLNNSTSSTTGKTSNKVIYNFTSNTALDLLYTIKKLDFLRIRNSAKDVIDFANINVKYHYDRHYQPMFLKVGDYAFLRLHKGYNIPANLGVIKKLTQQYVDSFKVLERIDRLIYRLNVPEDWKVHSVFTIAQLKPAPRLDSFDRPRSEYPPSVFVEGNIDTSKSYDLERLLNKRVIRKKRGLVTEYLIR